jgi:hypothetical protein
MSDEMTTPTTNSKIPPFEGQGQSSATPSNVISPEEGWGEIDRDSLGLDEEEYRGFNWVTEQGAALGRLLDPLARGASCSPEVPISNCLALTSTVLGNKVTIKIKNGWYEPIHLWGCIVGKPGSKKSASMKPFDDALKLLQQKRKLEYAEQKKLYSDKVKEIKKDAKNKCIENELIAELKKPKLRQLTVNDCTIEAICRVIDPEKPECACVLIDELTGLFKRLDNYNKGDRSFYLTAYNGGSYTVNRVKLEEPIDIPKLSLSILGGIQPDKTGCLFKGDDDGFSSRFLYVWAERQGGDAFTDNLSPESIKLLAEIFESLDSPSLLASPDKSAWSGVPGGIVLSVSEDAKELFRSWQSNHDHQMKYMTGRKLSSYSKMEGQLFRIAANLEFIFWAMKKQGSLPTEISGDAMKEGINLMENLFKPSLDKVLSMSMFKGNSSPLIKAIVEFLHYLLEKGEKIFNWHTYRDDLNLKKVSQEDKKKAMDLLVEANVLKENFVVGAKGGNTKEDYMVNPKIKDLCFDSYEDEERKAIVEYGG